MLKVRFVAAGLVIASALTACGSSDAGDADHAVDQAAHTNDAAGDCTVAIDGEAYTKVVDVYTTDGEAVAEWLRTRSSSGARVPDLEDRYSKIPTITTCLVDAPGIDIPRPPSTQRSNATDTESQFAILLIGVDEKPVLDTVGPADEVQALYDKLIARA